MMRTKRLLAAAVLILAGLAPFAPARAQFAVVDVNAAIMWIQQLASWVQQAAQMVRQIELMKNQFDMIKENWKAYALGYLLQQNYYVLDTDFGRQAMTPFTMLSRLDPDSPQWRNNAESFITRWYNYTPDTAGYNNTLSGLPGTAATALSARYSQLDEQYKSVLGVYQFLAAQQRVANTRMNAITWNAAAVQDIGDKNELKALQVANAQLTLLSQQNEALHTSMQMALANSAQEQLDRLSRQRERGVNEATRLQRNSDSSTYDRPSAQIRDIEGF